MDQIRVHPGMEPVLMMHPGYPETGNSDTVMEMKPLS
jgi:hypothetical protein